MHFTFWWRPPLVVGGKDEAQMHRELSEEGARQFAEENFGPFRRLGIPMRARRCPDRQVVREWARRPAA